MFARSLFILILVSTVWSTFAQQPEQTEVITTVTLRGSYYVEPGSYGTKRETDPPAYVRNLFKTGFQSAMEIDWMYVGLDMRNRTEYRQNDIRRAPTFSEDVPILFRSRGYLGFEERLGFLGAKAEFQDARRYNSQFAIDNRDWNPMTFIQAYGELKFNHLLPTDPLGNNRPILIRGGRMTFEFLDRRLISLNQWRNTSNNFLGARISVGQEPNEWQLDILALHPISRLVDTLTSTSDFDTARTDIWFNAAIGHWRKWSPTITIEPYYLELRQIAGPENGQVNRNILSPGIRFYGWLFDKKINYDVSTTLQFGTDAGQKKQAHLFVAEIGYTFTKSKMKPHFSLFYGEASGDKNPNDQLNNRFERFYGFARAWSADDYITPENIKSTAVRFEFQPYKVLTIDGGYSWYRLHSGTDFLSTLLNGANNRDTSGESGTNVGSGPNIRLRYRPLPYLDFVSGYSYFSTGAFVQNMQTRANGISAKASNFFFLETTINFIDLITAVNKNKAIYSVPKF